MAIRRRCYCPRFRRLSLPHTMARGAQCAARDLQRQRFVEGPACSSALGSLLRRTQGRAENCVAASIGRIHDKAPRISLEGFACRATRVTSPVPAAPRFRLSRSQLRSAPAGTSVHCAVVAARTGASLHPTAVYNLPWEAAHAVSATKQTIHPPTMATQ